MMPRECVGDPCQRSPGALFSGGAVAGRELVQAQRAVLVLVPGVELAATLGLREASSLDSLPSLLASMRLKALCAAVAAAEGPDGVVAGVCAKAAPAMANPAALTAMI